jgi:hypothetical protein
MTLVGIPSNSVLFMESHCCTELFWWSHPVVWSLACILESPECLQKKTKLDFGLYLPTEIVCKFSEDSNVIGGLRTTSHLWMRKLQPQDGSDWYCLTRTQLVWTPAEYSVLPWAQ